MIKRSNLSVALSMAALFFSLGGASLAASRYLITSRSQIAPRVQRALERPALVQQVPVAASYTDNEIVSGNPALLTTARPSGASQAMCGSGYHAITGGFFVDGAVIDDSYLDGADQQAWIAQGHLASGATQGRVQAWAECGPNS